MPNTLGFNICRFGGFSRIKQAKTFAYAASAYPRFKTLFSLGYAKTPRSISSMCRYLILNIFGGRNIAQIFQSVVVRISVNVVNVVFRPFTMRVKPNQSMRAIPLSIYGYNPVTEIIYSSRYAAHHYSPVSFDAPAKNAGRNIADKQFFKTFMSKHICAPVVFSCGRLKLVSRMKTP